MHKTSCYAIKATLTKTKNGEDLSFHIFKKKTKGNWKMTITTRHEHYVPYIKQIALLIGSFNGEGLWISIEEKAGIYQLNLS